MEVSLVAMPIIMVVVSAASFTCGAFVGMLLEHERTLKQLKQLNKSSEVIFNEIMQKNLKDLTNTKEPIPWEQKIGSATKL